MTSTAARPDAIRRHNLAVMLSHLHRDGAMTRANLTQRLGVSRSTIAALVADLTQLGLVREAVPTGLPDANSLPAAVSSGLPSVPSGLPNVPPGAPSVPNVPSGALPKS